MVQDIIAGAEIAVADKVEGSENDLNAGGTAMQKKKSISGMVRLLFRPTC
jgi:N-acetylmuramic acid 6-phosphate (MurNAc-6-P) etherase